MSMLQTVLHNCAPPEWEPASYSSKLYHLFDLEPNDEEYRREVMAFETCYPRFNVTSLKRYQNPLLLGRFKVRKEQLLRKETVTEQKWYHPVRKTDLKIALDYNMDVRRYSHTSGCSVDNKNPRFFSSPGTAFSACAGSSYGASSVDIVILVCNVLRGRYEPNPVAKSNDAEYMPMYVVEV